MERDEAREALAKSLVPELERSSLYDEACQVALREVDLLFSPSLAEARAAMEEPTERQKAAEQLAQIVLFLEDADCGADCGEFLHGMSGLTEKGGCDYCEAIVAYRAAAAPDEGEEP